MNKGIAIIALTAALSTTSGFAARRMSEQPVTAGADSVTTEQPANRELTEAKRKAAKLRAENRSLWNALKAALPYAEDGNHALQACQSVNLDTVDFEMLEGELKNLETLAPYSDKIKSHAESLGKFISIAREYDECRGLFDMPYSQAKTDSVENNLLNIYDAGEGILTEIQFNQIDSLYKKADKYRDAVIEFDNIVKAIDAETEQFRDNEKADRICSQEIERILEERKEGIAQIRGYKYISSRFDMYNHELGKNPRSRTPDIRKRIDMMLGRKSPDNETETDNRDLD